MVIRSALVSVVLTACSFQISADPAGGGGTTNDAASSDAMPPREPTIGPDVAITTPNGSSSRQPSLEWNGTLFGLAWQDQRDGNDEIYFARLDANGTKLTDDVRITNQLAASGEASLVWTGTEFGVAWRDDRDGNREIYFARIDASGVKQGADVRVTNSSQNSDRPSLTWTGTQFVVAWQDERDGNSEIYLARLDAAGVKQGVDIRVTNTTQNSERPSIDWTGTDIALAWQDERDGNEEIYVARFDAAGVRLGADVRVTNNAQASQRPSLVSTTTELCIAWEDERDGNQEIYLARLTLLGVEIGDDTRVTTNNGDSAEASLVWTGVMFALAWADDRDGNDEIYLATRAATGTPRTGDARTTSDAASSRDPSMAGAGLALGIAWTETRGGSDEIFFKTVAL